MSNFVIWGKEIPEDLIQYELALCRGLIPESLESKSVKLSKESSYFGKGPHYQRYSDEILLQDIDSLIQRKKIKKYETIQDWLDPEKKFHYGMSSYADFCGMQNMDFGSFSRCKYGTRIPAMLLDPGIALMVKVLPFIGVLSSFSCAGHFKESPKIFMLYIYHHQWLKCVLMNALSSSEIDLKNVHRIDMSEGLVFLADKEDKDDHYRAYWRIQKIARYLLDKVNSEKIRLVKFTFTNEKELFDTDLVLSRLSHVNKII
jgi:hypothetical protein